MRRTGDPAAWIVLVLLLATVFFPALFLGRVAAPEVTLKNVPPWRLQWGPSPAPQARALAAATELGPRLHVIAREGTRAAIWNPWIGGGRPGWLASAREGGAPLVVAAGLLARPEWAWTALIGLQVALAFAGTVLVLRRMDVAGWAAAAGGLVYALSGAAAGHWLDWQGSALALGPFALLPALGGSGRWRARTAAWAAIVLVLLLATVFFPALFLGRVVAPEVTLKNVPPWRLQWGPSPAPQARALDAATRLGPRLHVIAREGARAAIWNPWIGGGRPGWLASAREGGAPLVVAAGLLARPEWAWTALIGLQVALAFGGTVLVLRRMDVAGWAAAAGGLVYALSGAAAGHWLDWQGSALALGPFALLPALGGPGRWRARTAAWAAVLIVLLLCGPPALPFVAFALAVALLRGGPTRVTGEITALALASAIALAALSPRLVLDRHSTEPDTPAAAHELPAAPVRPEALVIPSAAQPVEPGATNAIDGNRALAFLGLPALLLAAVGAWFAPSRSRGILIAVALVSLLGCLLPESALAHTGLVERPFGTLALATALLAGLGAAALAARCPPAAAPLLGVLLCAAPLARLLPPAVAALPFGGPAEARPSVFLPARVQASAGRVLPLLDALPPDVGARFALADLRASAFVGEPRYRALLGSRDGRTVAVSRALDPRTARLGARWLLEPLPLRVVSGALFSGIDAGEARQRPSMLGSAVVYEVTAPDRVCRVGLPTTIGRPTQLVLATAGRTARLLPDPALAGESDRWSWFALPEGWPAGPTVLEIERGDVDWPDRLPVVADRSGLRLVSEESGVRLWQWERAPGPAFLADGVVAEDAALPPDPRVVGLPAEVAEDAVAPPDPADRVELTLAAPGSLDVEARCRGACVLVLQVKYRPGLWRLAADGGPATPLRVDGVWTGVALGPGDHLVRARARLPLGSWLLASLALLAIPALAAGRRPR